MRHVLINIFEVFKGVCAGGNALNLDGLSRSMNQLNVNLTKEEIVDFVDNLQQKDLDKIRVFFETMPKIKKNIYYKCKKCGYNENLTLEGIQSFFE